MSKTQLEREEDALEDVYNQGAISLSEYNKEMREIQSDYQFAAEQAAQEAYDAEMNRW